MTAAPSSISGVLLVALMLGVAACGPSVSGKGRVVPAPVLATRSPADELYELSPARVQIRRLAPQALRLLAPHWSRVRKSDRLVLQATLVSTLSETRVTPFVRVKLEEAVKARPDLAGQAIEWLRSPVGYEVKFAEATAWSGDKASDGAFYASVAEVRDNRTPEIRIGRIRRLADETGALEKTLDITSAAGTVAARLVNVTRPGEKPVPLATLRSIVERERERPEVRPAYEPVVIAALLTRCRDLDLQELDSYIEFAGTDAGRWYHDTISSALVAGVSGASMDVEGVFEANAHSEASAPLSGGINLDALQLSLPSGREVRFLTFATGGSQDRPSIVLRYETSLPLRDTGAIGREAVEVWDKVRGQLESEGAKAAVLQATGSVEGWVFPFALSRRFTWSRGDDGSWSATPGSRATSTPTQREMLWSVPP